MCSLNLLSKDFINVKLWQQAILLAPIRCWFMSYSLHVFSIYKSQNPHFQFRWTEASACFLYKKVKREAKHIFKMFFCLYLFINFYFQFVLYLLIYQYLKKTHKKRMVDFEVACMVLIWCMKIKLVITFVQLFNIARPHASFFICKIHIPLVIIDVKFLADFNLAV